MFSNRQRSYTQVYTQSFPDILLQVGGFRTNVTRVSLVYIVISNKVETSYIRLHQCLRRILFNQIGYAFSCLCGYSLRCGSRIALRAIQILCRQLLSDLARAMGASSRPDRLSICTRYGLFVTTVQIFEIKGVTCGYKKIDKLN